MEPYTSVLLNWNVVEKRIREMIAEDKYLSPKAKEAYAEYKKEQEKEAFLKAFDETNEGTLVGFCVMGGIFGEGIDLRAERLIGAVIVGTGLPQVCNERELFRNYFDGINGNGFEYAYLYNGMNKVLQSAGRVIRTSDDRGAILLLDERFAAEQYRSLFPQEWYPYMYVDLKSVGEILKHFWNGVLT